MQRRWLTLALASTLALSLGRTLPAQARQRGGRARLPAARQAAPIRPPVMRSNPGGGGKRQGVPPKWMNRLQEMSPQEQERFLENNKRFQNMPPERQAQIRSRLRQWNSLSPQQKEALRRRAQILERMPPQERRELRQVILPQWRQLPPERRQVLIQKLKGLQGLDDSERQQRLNDPAFMQDLSPDEQHLLRELSNLKVGPGGGSL